MATIQKSINQAKILVVDDLPSARKILSKLIQNCGVCEIAIASNGEEAAAILQTQQIDIVISDWHMPLIDGLGLIAIMKQKEILEKIPFIMITSSAESGEVKEALNAGVDDYICKPFSLSVIQEKLNKYFSEV